MDKDQLLGKRYEEARQLAKDVLSLASSGGMPDNFWHTDSRVARACKQLGITTAEALIKITDE